MSQPVRSLTCLVALVVVAGFSADAQAAARAKQTQHASKQAQHAKKSDTKVSDAKKSDTKKSDAKKSDTASVRHHKKVAHEKGKPAAHTAANHSAPPVKEAPPEPAALQLTGDAALVKNAIDLVRKGKTADATAVEQSIADPAAKKLVEWFILRNPDAELGFSRYAAFMVDNSGWPGMGMMRRRAEARLWQDHADAAAVHAITGDRPVTAKGHFALARVLLAEGNAETAAREVRTAWAADELTERTENDALEVFRNLLRSEDYRARMDRRIGAKDFSGAMRAAHHLGSDELAIVKACVAANGGEKKAQGLLDDAPAAARQDLGYLLCRVNFMMRQNKFVEAAQLVAEAPSLTMAQQDTDEWWRARRLLARKLLDLSQFDAAYQVARPAALPDNENYRAEAYFLPGWIALRYLHDAATARRHFAHIDDGTADPIVKARANYWRGRAAEALGDSGAMWTSYEAAARNTTAYYGQLARARLGIDAIALRDPPPADPMHVVLTDELVRAADMLYAVGERDVVVSFVASLAEECRDAAMLAALGELTARHDDARAMLELGKAALARGLALDTYAFPTIGIPQHKPIAPDIGRSMTYAVARTESAFNQRDRSWANAVGLMQVTPEAGRDTAKRFGVSYDWDRMVNDPVYNTQMGAAELSALLREYKGCHIMIFAGYNAGRGRVREWVKQFGDPRDPNVDAVDWVERIPLAETRNYVQRVMENFLVYQVRFDKTAPEAAVSSAGSPAAGPEANALPPDLRQPAAPQ
jgi:soluble lytic murein transglycosylase